MTPQNADDILGRSGRCMHLLGIKRVNQCTRL